MSARLDEEARHVAAAVLALDDELAAGVELVARDARLRAIEREFMTGGVSGRNRRLADEYLQLTERDGR